MRERAGMGDQVAESTYLDDMIWERLGVKSPKQIADELGVDTLFVAQRIREMLDGVDDLSLKEKRMKVMADLQRITNEVSTAAKNASDERNVAGLYNSAINAMKETLRQLTVMEKRDDEAVNRLNEMRVRELWRLVESAVTTTLAEIAQKHALDEDELTEVFQRHLAATARQLDAS